MKKFWLCLKDLPFGFEVIEVEFTNDAMNVTDLFDTKRAAYEEILQRLNLAISERKQKLDVITRELLDIEKQLRYLHEKVQQKEDYEN